MQPEGGRVDHREVEVRVAEPGVELDRDALAGRLLDGDHDEVVEQRLRLDPEPTVAPAPPRGPSANAASAVAAVDGLELEPAAIGDDRLQADDAARRGGRRAPPGRRRGTRRSRPTPRISRSIIGSSRRTSSIRHGARPRSSSRRERRVGAVARVDQPGLEVAARRRSRGSATRDRARAAPRGRRRASARSRAGRPARGSSIGRRASAGRRPGRSPGSTTRSGGSGTRRRRPAASRSSEWQWLSTIGIDARSRGIGDARLST